MQRFEKPGRQFERGEVFREEYPFRIPRDGMHTFAASHNWIEWYVKLSVELRQWPDLNQYHEITVIPELAG